MALDRAFVEMKEFVYCFFTLLRSSKGSRNKVIPALLTAFAILRHKQCPRSQFADSFEDRVWRWRIPESQEKVDRRGIDLRFGIFCGENCANIRAKRDSAIREPIIDQLDAHGITRNDQPLVRHIPDGETKHAVEVIEDISSPFFVTMDDYFRVAIRPELVPFILELRPQFFVVINLAVEDD